MKSAKKVRRIAKIVKSFGFRDLLNPVTRESVAVAICNAVKNEYAS